MSNTSFEFPYRFRYSDDHRLPYPEVTVSLQTIAGNLKYRFIVDSGADITTMPDYMITVLDIPSSQLTKSRSFGIAEEAIESYESTIRAKIGSLTFDLPVIFVPNNDVPLLLGKEGIFNRFNIYFDNDHEKTILSMRK